MGTGYLLAVGPIAGYITTIGFSPIKGDCCIFTTLVMVGWNGSVEKYGWDAVNMVLIKPHFWAR